MQRAGERDAKGDREKLGEGGTEKKSWGQGLTATPQRSTGTSYRFNVRTRAATQEYRSVRQKESQRLGEGKGRAVVKIQTNAQP